MRNYLTFAGARSDHDHVYISGQGTFVSPARTQTRIPVPGRNGDLMSTISRLENVEIRYNCFIHSETDAYDDFSYWLNSFKDWLLSNPGYQTLTDTYHPNEFRYASFDGPINPEVTLNNKAGTFEIVFNCKPQIYTDAGQTVLDLTSGGSIINPYEFDALPEIRVQGSGTVSIGNYSFTVSDNGPNDTLVIDCENMDCYERFTKASRNQNVSFTGNEFPKLIWNESNTVVVGTGITSLYVKPRYWHV